MHQKTIQRGVVFEFVLSDVIPSDERHALFGDVALECQLRDFANLCIPLLFPLPFPGYQVFAVFPAICRTTRRSSSSAWCWRMMMSSGVIMRVP